MFVGREQELASLEEFYAKDGIGMTVIYGRRRMESYLLRLSKIKKLYFIPAKKWKKQKEIRSLFHLSLHAARSLALFAAD